jgi:5-methylcytosine-specific restriction endonuclease McrA
MRRPCLFPDCPAIQDGTYCDAHRRAKQRERQRSRPRFEVRLYGSAEWRRLADAVVAASDRCHWCGSPGPLTADHIVKVRDRPDLALEEGNCVAACRSCQNRRINRPNPATWAPWERGART